jgi:hypothetical protein
MCLGSSKPKEQTPPKPNPPTSFDYSAGNRAPQQQQAANAAADSVASPSSFGAELGK